MSITDAAPAGGDASKNEQGPNEIGWLFVPQYYTFVNKDPSRLHCFYTKRSTFIHGTEGEECQPRHGQQEIHDKILSLGFEECKVYVSNVDSQSSAEGGIVVQVLGEMSNRGGDWRKFAQTFFLAPQANGYFVLNDIFRYIKEEDSDREDPSPPSGEVMAATSQSVADAFASLGASNGRHGLDSLNMASTTTLSSSLGLAQPMEMARSSEHHQVNGWHTESPDVSAVAIAARSPSPLAPSESTSVSALAIESPANEATEPATAPSASAPAPAESLRSPSPPPPPPAAPSVEATPASQQSIAAPEPSAPVASMHPEPPSAPAPAMKKTWANLAASSGAWKAGAPAPRAALSAAPVSSSSTQATPPPVQQHAAPSQPPPPPQASTSSGRPIPNIAGINHASCFVKNVQEMVTDEGLRRTLEDNFGPIKELDIIRSKACAFLEFKTVESARRAIQFCSPHSVGGQGGIECDGMFIHIEEKKPKGDATRPTGGIRGGRGGAVGGGRGGGASGATRGTATRIGSAGVGAARPGK